MNDVMAGVVKDGTAVLMAIIGIAILYVLVSNRNNTSSIVQSFTHGFSDMLGTAMGGNQG